jgi:hypothetical protein
LSGDTSSLSLSLPATPLPMTVTSMDGSYMIVLVGRDPERRCAFWINGCHSGKSSKESASMRFGNHFEWAETCPSDRLLRFQYQTKIGGSIGIRKWFKASKDVLQYAAKRPLRSIYEIFKILLQEHFFERH